jgi:hypothetical protein
MPCPRNICSVFPKIKLTDRWSESTRNQLISTISKQRFYIFTLVDKLIYSDHVTMETEPIAMFLNKVSGTTEFIRGLQNKMESLYE